MKGPPRAIGATQWVIGGFLAVYLIGGVIYYFDLRTGMRIISGIPEPLAILLFALYGHVILFLGNFWPQYFPYYS